MGLKLTTSILLTAVLATGTTANAKDVNSGDQLRETAASYSHKADSYQKSGMDDIATIYQQMARIKRHAAQLADQDRWDDIDWTEYHQLEEKLGKLYSQHKKTHK
ncbi:MAG: hypothetical protein OQK12_10380 [Motiliproteus sp.]|nr:hypothetical protein [Motiliproteus sp.]MCW9052820.1 hypothetical protein [Motiliproteus sp.]